MKELCVFPDNGNPHRNQKLDQLILLRDRERGPYLIASRFQKHKIAIIPLSDHRITHFAFEEKVIKLALCQSTHKLSGSHE
jgi:hypothetical protein